MAKAGPDATILNGADTSYFEERHMNAAVACSLAKAFSYFFVNNALQALLFDWKGDYPHPISTPWASASSTSLATPTCFPMFLVMPLPLWHLH